MARFFCCGGAHLDFTARCKATFVAGASNPVTVASSTGGAALNTALNLKRLGNDVTLFSAVGDDPAGARLIQTLRTEGFAAEGILQQSGQRTAAYTAVLDLNGDLAAGLADMEIYDQVSADDFLQVIERFPIQPARGDFVFLDANFPAPVLSQLVAAFRSEGVTLCAAAVSPAKVSRLVALLADFDLLFCNKAEVAALCGQEVESDPDLNSAAAAFSDQRALKLLVTRGAKGAVLAEQGKLTEFSAGQAEVVDVNGAGDAFASGTLHALGLGQAISDAIAFGQAAAALTLEVECSTSENLSPKAVSKRIPT